MRINLIKVFIGSISYKLRLQLLKLQECLRNKALIFYFHPFHYIRSLSLFNFIMSLYSSGYSVTILSQIVNCRMMYSCKYITYVNDMHYKE